MNLGQSIPVQNPTPAPLPFAWGTLYRHANPDGSRKRCVNCVFWVPSKHQCSLHEASVQVDDQDTCGYHVFGEPADNWNMFSGIQHVKPELSGLRDAGSGVSCANCKFYQVVDQTSGLCRAIAAKNGQPPQPVESLGWCARYQGMAIGG